MRWVLATIIALLIVLGLGLGGQITISPPPGKKDPVNIGETPPFSSPGTTTVPGGGPPPAADAITTEAGDPIQTEGGDDITTE